MSSPIPIKRGSSSPLLPLPYSLATPSPCPMGKVEQVFHRNVPKKSASDTLQKNLLTGKRTNEILSSSLNYHSFPVNSGAPATIGNLLQPQATMPSRHSQSHLRVIPIMQSHIKKQVSFNNENSYRVFESGPQSSINTSSKKAFEHFRASDDLQNIYPENGNILHSAQGSLRGKSATFPTDWQAELQFKFDEEAEISQTSSPDSVPLPKSILKKKSSYVAQSFSPSPEGSSLPTRSREALEHVTAPEELQNIEQENGDLYSEYRAYRGRSAKFASKMESSYFNDDEGNPSSPPLALSPLTRSFSPFPQGSSLTTRSRKAFGHLTCSSDKENIKPPKGMNKAPTKTAVLKGTPATFSQNWKEELQFLFEEENFS